MALSDRKLAVARDVYDVCYFFKSGFTLNEELIRERTGKGLKEYLGYLIKFIEKNYNPKNILQGLGEVLEEKQKEWARRELIPDTIAEIRKRLKGPVPVKK